jgi:succinyl-CoA synthetase beta subunit
MIEWKTWQKNKKLTVRMETSLISSASMMRINNFVESVKRDRTVLTNFEANEVLKEAGITLPQYATAPSIDEAIEFTKKYSFPVILKISSWKLLHKTEAGGIITNITNEKELQKGYAKISIVLDTLKKDDADAEIIIEQLVPSGIEVIAGIKRDENFGTVLLFGAGGIFTELMADTTLRCLPVDKESLREMILASKIGKILSGYRGGKAYAIDKLITLLTRLTQLAEQSPLISEIEINPIIVTENTVYAVDGKALLTETALLPEDNFEANILAK